MWLCIECTKLYISRFSFINMQLYAKLNVISRFWWKATCTEELLYFMQCSKLRLLKVKHIIFSYIQIVSIRYKFDWCPPTKKFTTHQPPLKINIIHLFNGSLIVGANRLISSRRNIYCASRTMVRCNANDTTFHGKLYPTHQA